MGFFSFDFSLNFSHLKKPTELNTLKCVDQIPKATKHWQFKIQNINKNKEKTKKNSKDL